MASPGLVGWPEVASPLAIWDSVGPSQIPESSVGDDFRAIFDPLTLWTIRLEMTLNQNRDELIMVDMTLSG